MYADGCMEFVDPSDFKSLKPYQRKRLDILSWINPHAMFAVLPQAGMAPGEQKLRRFSRDNYSSVCEGYARRIRKLEHSHWIDLLRFMNICRPSCTPSLLLINTKKYASIRRILTNSGCEVIVWKRVS